MKIILNILFKLIFEMGIKYLNHFLIKYANEGITKLKLDSDFFRNKIIVVDISIYMYKFSLNNKLVENFHKFLILLSSSNIKPIFVFDGKPTAEKQLIIDKRKKEKQLAKIKYEELINYTKENNIMQQNTEYENELKSLKKQFQQIKKKDYVIVKQLLKHWNCLYYEAPNEADEYCMQLIKKQQNNILGCLTDDMDFIAFGTPYVFRNLNLFDGTICVYNLEKIIQQLNMTFSEFQQFILCCGFNFESKSIEEIENIYLHFNYFKKNCSNDIKFIDWYYSIIEINSNNKIQQLIQPFESIEINTNINSLTNPIMKNNDYKKILLIEEGFIPFENEIK